jgi:hypothetical protein
MGVLDSTEHRAKKDRWIMDTVTAGRDTGCGDVELHTEHLCYIVSQGFDLGDESSYRTLVTNPKFQCGHCGRKAASDKNLCVPGKD